MCYSAWKRTKTAWLTLSNIPNVWDNLKYLRTQKQATKFIQIQNTDYHVNCIIVVSLLSWKSINIDYIYFLRYCYTKINTSRQKTNKGKSKKSKENLKKNKNKNRAFAYNNNDIRISIHHPRNRIKTMKTINS